jgi:hypothetical protein
MSKEPGRVSIAVPDYEKARLNGGMKRMPNPMSKGNGFKTGGGSYLPEQLPNPIDNQGNFAQGGGQLKRVSPGVYRNSQGQLVGSRGQSIRGGGRQDGNPMQSAIQGVAQGAGMGFGKGGSITSALQGAQQGAMGGAQGYGPNDAGAMAGRLAKEAANGMGGGMNNQFNDMMQRFNGPKDQQTMQAEAEAMAQQAAGPMGNIQWSGQGNGPGSPNDVNPWFGKQNGQPNAPQMNMQWQEQMPRFQQMQQKPGQMPQGMQSGYMPFPQGQQGQIRDMMYRFPQGQAPQFGQIFGRMQQQQQQPNTVSGLLQKQRG